MSDTERRQWVENDEGLYLLWKRSGVGLYRWTREHRTEIDAVIEVVTGRSRPKKYDTAWATGYGEVRR